MFSTKIDIQSSADKIEYSSKILTLGSCFSENIGIKLKNGCFDVDINPFGVLFNPVSISESIELLLQKKVFTDNDLFRHNSLWGSFTHSTLFSDSSAEKCLHKINSRVNIASKNLHICDYLIITFGTAWIYKLADNGKIVANCHKLPTTKFIRKRLTANEISETYSKLITNLQAINPKLKIIFTVSPVRHWKDGPTENNISKGIILQATQEIVKTHAQTHYFPAYEIVLDELRDYRFYAADMLHPSEVAVDYIFNEFTKAYFNDETLNCYKQVKQLQTGLAHRPIHTDTAEFEHFTKQLASKKQVLLNRYPILKDRI